MPRKSSRKSAAPKKEHVEKTAKKKKAEEMKADNVEKTAKTVPKNYWPFIGVVLAVLLLGIGVGYFVANTSAGAPEGTQNTTRAILLMDDGCNSCGDTMKQVVSILDDRFQFASIPREEVSVQSDEGRKIYNVLLENNINVVPLIVLEGNIEDTAFYKTLDKMLAQYGGAQRVLLKADKYYILLPDWPTRKYDPNKPETPVRIWATDTIRSIIAPYVYQTVENAKIIEEEPSKDYVLKLEGPKTLIDSMKTAFSGAMVEGNALLVPKKETVDVELYVMSFCPFGNQAEGLIPQLKETFGDRIHIVPHYIISDLGNNQFRSLHGDQELHQDIREACVYKLFGEDAWLDFVLAINKNCSASNADSCWEGVAKDMNLDVNAIKQCYDTEFNSIAAREAAISAAKGVTGSPTTLIDGWFKADVRNSKFPELVCAFMKNPPEGACETELQASAASGSCG